MADEQLMILKMLEDGKITAEQATELLNLVNRQRAAATENRAPERTRTEQQQLDHLVREEARKARRQVKQQVRATSRLERQARHIPSPGSLERTVQKSLEMLGLSFGGGQGFAFAKDMQGQFTASNPRVTVQNTNGKVILGQSRDQEWHLTLEVRVRSGSESAAREWAENLVSVQNSGSSLTIQSQRLFGQNAAADITLLLPVADRLRLAASCTNGTINLTKLVGEELALKTVNGKIVARQFQATEIEANSVNGGIELAGLARRIHCRAANGRVTVLVDSSEAAELDLQTVNGPITAHLSTAPQVGYQVDAESTAGRIDVALPDLVRDEKLRPGHRQVRAKSRQRDRSTVLQSVKAKTVSGRITILGEGEVLGDD